MYTVTFRFFFYFSA
ncbi:pheST operon leader peptide PheM [Yersinia mollaretii]